MDFEFLDPAAAEFLDAVVYYNEARPGLGIRFAHELAAAIERVSQFPEAWPKISSRTRVCRTRDFPYGVLYQIRGEIILIIAVMHMQRDPDYWRGRVGPEDD